MSIALILGAGAVAWGALLAFVLVLLTASKRSERAMEQELRELEAEGGIASVRAMGDLLYLNPPAAGPPPGAPLRSTPSAFVLDRLALRLARVGKPERVL